MDGVNFSLYTEGEVAIFSSTDTDSKIKELRRASFKIHLNDYTAVKLFELLIDYMHYRAENDAG